MKTSLPTSRVRSYLGKMLGGIALAASLFQAATGYGADLDALKRSRWDSYYQDSAGSFRVHTTVVFENDHGWYYLDNGQVGVFSSVQYDTASTPGTVNIVGRWELFGIKGVFSFAVPDDGQSFNGYWSRQDTQPGQWQGRRR